MSKVLRPRPISGFPEYLPQIRAVELRWLDTIRRVFESYGFANIETPSVEALEVLAAKGATEKEIYTLTRLHAEADEAREARLALHFDLTVPFARYAAQYFNDLDFPFKRYQMQRVWRGERPQDGRFREFTQCDVDVINVDQLPLAFDAELPSVVLEAIAALDVGPVTLQVSNRRLLTGFLNGLGLADSAAVVRSIDRLDKIGIDAVRVELAALGLSQTQVDKAAAFAAIRSSDVGFVDQVRALAVGDDALEAGLAELAFVVTELAASPAVASGAARVVADLSIARGLDYYSGTVYEGRLDDAPGYGAITAGGRYADLAGSFINKALPGVGISLGLTRLFARQLSTGRLEGQGARTPTQVLVVLEREEERRAVGDLARQLRARGLAVEAWHSPQKLARQLTYAARKAIPHVWFPAGTAAETHQVKDMTTGHQAPADPASWTPPVPPRA